MKILKQICSAVSRSLFTLAPWFLIWALSYIFFEEISRAQHDPTLLATVVVLLLVVTLFSRYENELIGRIKKIGPLELFEEAHEAFPDLGEIGTKIPLERLGAGLLFSRTKPLKLLRQESFHFQQADIAISLLELTKAYPEKTKHRDKYFDLLCKVGSWSFAQNDWARATIRLDKLRTLSSDSFQPETVLPLAGLAYFYWALGEEDADTRKVCHEKAIEAFSKMVVLGRADYLTYFYLAYAQDEIGQYIEAISSNKEALRRRPHFAPAKYNIAVSYVKLKHFKIAVDWLQKVTKDDERGLETLKSAMIDPELEPLRVHEPWKSQVSLFLEGPKEGN